MGRCMRQYDKDHMKMAMLKQEEAFRQQVHELHRLYRVQKLLMNDMTAELKRQKKSAETRARLERWNSETETDSHQPYYSHQNQRSQRKMLDLELPAEKYIENDDEESELDLTLAIGGNRRRKKDNSFSSDSGVSFSSSSTDNGYECRIPQVPLINLDGYWSERKSKFNVEERIMEERVNCPPWFLQCLCLNTT